MSSSIAFSFPLSVLSSGISGASGVSVGILSIGSSYRFSSSGCTCSSMISSRSRVKSEVSAIWNGRKFLKILGTRVFRSLKSESREDERVQEFGGEVERSSPTVAIQSNLCGLMIISLNFTCRDLNAKLKQHAVF